MNALLNNTSFASTTSGTTDFGVGAAATGAMTPAQAGAVNGALYHYNARSSDGTQWEIGSGTYSTTGPTLARTTVLFSSNGNAKVVFTNPPRVSIDALAEDIAAPYMPSRTIDVVQQYGADPTAVIEATSIVQAIINSFGAVIGGELYFDGTFLLSTLTFPAAASWKLKVAGQINMAVGQTLVLPPFTTLHGECGTYADQFGPQGSGVGLIVGSSTSNPVVQTNGGQQSIKDIRINPPAGIGLQVLPTTSSGCVYLENVSCRAQKGNPNSIPLQIDSVYWITAINCTFLGDVGSNPRPIQLLQTKSNPTVPYLGISKFINMRMNAGGVYMYSCTASLASAFLFEDVHVENMVSNRSMFEFDTTFATFTGSIAAGTNQLVVSAIASGHIEVGNILAGTGIITNPNLTYITAIPAGGGPGTYTVSQVHPSGVASTTITTTTPILSNIKIVRPKNYDAVGTTYLIKNSGGATRDIVVDDWDCSIPLLDPTSTPIVGGVKITARHVFPYSTALPTIFPSAYWTQNYEVDYWGALDAKLITAPRGPQAIGGYALAVEQDPTTWPAPTGGGILVTGIIGPDGMPTAGQLSGPNAAAITLNNVTSYSFAVGDWLIPTCYVQADPVLAGPAAFTASINGTTMTVSAVQSGYLSVGQQIAAPIGPVSFFGWIDGGTVLHVVPNAAPTPLTGTLLVGMAFTGAGVAAGSSIIGLGTGYGLDGTYTITPSQSNVGSSGAPVSMQVGVKVGTSITALGTGVGGVGDYTITPSQTTVSQAMVGAGRNPANVELLMAPTTFALDNQPAAPYRAFLDSEHGPAKLGNNSWVWLCQAHKITGIGANPAKATLVLMRTTSAGVTNFDKPGIIHIPCAATFTASVAAGALDTLVVSAVASGRLMVGMVLAGGLAAGTKITSYSTGVGGTGNYKITPQSGAVASQAMTGNRNIPDADVMNMARSLNAFRSGAQPGDVSLLDNQKLMIGGGVRIFSAPSPPVSGVYNVGDRCINSAPTSGTPEGWTYTGASLGWRPYGITDIGSIREVTTNTSFTAVDTDNVIGLNPTTGASFTITLPLASSRSGRSITVVDLKGFCTAFPISVALSGSDTCVGKVSPLTNFITSDFQSVTFRPRASGGWYV